VSATDLVAERALSRRARPDAAVLVALAGAVSVGKSTFAEELAHAIDALGARAEVVSTDGFLLSDRTLLERGLMHRKGFPDSYDAAALRRFADAVRSGERDVVVPVYSHITYDVVPELAHPLPRCDVVVVEGVNALGALAGKTDLGVYLDAAEADLETWYVDRFVALCDEARHDPQSFYRQFVDLDRRAVEALARSTWSGVNLPNLREHIAPTRSLADVVVVKGPGHVIAEVREHA
jgi:type I pantothenate kinase